MDFFGIPISCKIGAILSINPELFKKIRLGFIDKSSFFFPCIEVKNSFIMRPSPNMVFAIVPMTKFFSCNFLAKGLGAFDRTNFKLNIFQKENIIQKPISS